MGNPLAHVVCALKQSSTMNKVSRKIRLYERIAHAKRDDRRTYLQASAVDQYPPLDAAQVEKWITRFEERNTRRYLKCLLIDKHYGKCRDGRREKKKASRKAYKKE